MKSRKYYHVCKDLDHILAYNRPFEEFDSFWNAHCHQLNEIIPRIAYREMLFAPPMINAYSREQLLSLAEYAHLNYICAILMDHNIPCEIRAFFWHHLHKTFTWIAQDEFYLNNLVRECKHIRYHLGGNNLRLFYLENERKFINSTKYKRYSLPESTVDALQSDSMSAFEMTRFMLGKDFTKTFFLSAIDYGAEKTLLEMLEKYSKEIFSWHTPEEWLFIICNRYNEEAATIPAIRIIEEKFPGTVKNAKDPWGANLLWNTFFGEHSYWRYREIVEKLQVELMCLGCDPDEKNDLGLSFNLVMENSPDKWESELGLCAEN
jgi:hypothetical protein